MIVTKPDFRGVMTDVNEEFRQVVGDTENKLPGQLPASIIRHLERPAARRRTSILQVTPDTPETTLEECSEIGYATLRATVRGTRCHFSKK